MAIVSEDPENPTKQTVLHLANITHRDQAIRKHMIQRAMFRRRRRTANLQQANNWAEIKRRFKNFTIISIKKTKPAPASSGHNEVKAENPRANPPE